MPISQNIFLSVKSSNSFNEYLFEKNDIILQ